MRAVLGKMAFPNTLSKQKADSQAWMKNGCRGRVPLINEVLLIVSGKGGAIAPTHLPNSNSIRFQWIVPIQSNSVVTQMAPVKRNHRANPKVMDVGKRFEEEIFVRS